MTHIPEITSITTSGIVKAMSILISFMAVVIGGLLLFIPPIGTIVGIILYFMVFIINLYLFTLRIHLTPTELIKSSLLGSEVIDLDQVAKLDRMRLVGTVANSPLAIRYITLVMEQGQQTISTLFFPYEDMLDLLEDLDELLQT